MSYTARTRYVDDALMDDVFDKLNRLGKYASRQELLDEIRDLNVELDREKKMLETYRTRYETKQSESSNLSRNLDNVREYQSSLMKEHRDLENKYSQLQKENVDQKTDIKVLKKELDTKEMNYFLNRRRFLDTLTDERWLRETDLERSSGSKYRYWHWRPWLYRHHRDLYDKYYPYTSYDPSWYRYSSYYPYYSPSTSSYLYDYPYSSSYYYSRYWPYYTSSGEWTLARKLDMEAKLDSIQRMTDDLKVNNSRMLSDLKYVKAATHR